MTRISIIGNAFLTYAWDCDVTPHIIKCERLRMSINRKHLLLGNRFHIREFTACVVTWLVEGTNYGYQIQETENKY